tara:strand:+ start:374 stop:1396 length:1023 start_codon:yes stop_codon:yes gene_type:complete
MGKNKRSFTTISYDNGVLSLLDQTKLPTQESYINIKTVEEVATSIETMIVRGAPAIGITAAYGIAIAAKTNTDFMKAHDRLARTRPTAVNLFWALNRMKKIWETGCTVQRLEDEAHRIYQEDVQSCKKIGQLGSELIKDGSTILTHCNAGALATSEYGTALSIIREAHNSGKQIKVYADETRPVLQGSRLTAWELMKDGIDVTVIPDNAVAHLLSKDLIDCAVVGADRIAANGDVANKIGTRQISCLLFHHFKPVYVAAPWSTIDMNLNNGSEIIIEERSSREVTHIGNVQIAPTGVAVENPAFDITPNGWLAGIVTEEGFTGTDIKKGISEQLLKKMTN